MVDGRKGLFRSVKPPSLPVLQGMYPDRPKDSEIHFDTLAPSAKIKMKKMGKTSFTRNPPENEREINNRRKCTQILSKNELVINAEEEKGEEEGRKRKQTNKQTNKQNQKTHNRMDMVKTEKRKEKQEVLLNYQEIPLPCLRNKTKARQKINENNREKNKKPKGEQKLGWPVHILDLRKPGLGKNSGTHEAVPKPRHQSVDIAVCP